MPFLISVYFGFKTSLKKNKNRLLFPSRVLNQYKKKMRIKLMKIHKYPLYFWSSRFRKPTWMYSHHFLILSLMLRSWKKLPVGALRSREQTHLPRVTSLHFIRSMEQREKWAFTHASGKHAWALAPLYLTHQNRNQAETVPAASGEIIKGNPTQLRGAHLVPFPVSCRHLQILCGE